MEVERAIEVIQGLVSNAQSQAESGRWSIVVLDRGFVYIGKLSYDENGHGVLVNAANIRRWGTTRGLGEIQCGPTNDTVLDPCSHPVRFSGSIVILDASGEGWHNAY